MYLLDTNVICEADKPRPHPSVVRWLLSIDSATVFTSVIAVGEMRFGIEKLRKHSNLADVGIFMERLRRTEVKYADRILPFDQKSASIWGQVFACYPHAPALIDTQIAAIALANHATLVTRDQDFVELAARLKPFGFELRLFNPFL